MIYARVENSVSQSRVNGAERFVGVYVRQVVQNRCRGLSFSSACNAKLSPFLPPVHSSPVEHPSISLPWLSLFQLHIDIYTPWTKKENSYFRRSWSFFLSSSIRSVSFLFNSFLNSFLSRLMQFKDGKINRKIFSQLSCNSSVIVFLYKY